MCFLNWNEWWVYNCFIIIGSVDAVITWCNIGTIFGPHIFWHEKFQGGGTILKIERGYQRKFKDDAENFKNGVPSTP